MNPGYTGSLVGGALNMRAYFDKFRSNLELTPTLDGIVQARHQAIRNVLADRDSKLIGSLQRRTRIQPRVGDVFDIDILIIGQPFTRWASPLENGMQPMAALQQLYERIEASDRYSKKEPTIDAPTVTLAFAQSITVELTVGYPDEIGYSFNGVAHYPRGRAFWVPKGTAWELADYDYDADFISLRNQQCDGWLVPSIKMLKAARREWFGGLSSYGLEILAASAIPVAINALKYERRAITFGELIRRFFALAPLLLDEPLEIPGSLSKPVDVRSFATGLRATFTNIREGIAVIMASPEPDQPSGWREVFGDAFPLRIDA